MKFQEISPYRLRVFDRERDYDTMRVWWKEHTDQRAPEAEFLPKLGVVAIDGDGEQIAMGFVYMDNSTGVSFFEFPVSRPGLSLKQVHAAFRIIVDFLKMRTSELGYVVMFGYASRGVARIARPFGFQSIRTNTEMVFSMLQEGK